MVEVHLPTAHGQCHSVLQEFHCPLSQGTAARCSTRLHCPLPPRRCSGVLQGFHCPLATGNASMFCMSSTGHCPKEVRQCALGVPLPAALSAALCGRTSTTPCPEVVRRCIEEVPLCTAQQERRSVLQKFHCPLCQGTAAMCGRSAIAHYPKASGSVRWEFHS